jgi:hypothetical protein
MSGFGANHQGMTIRGNAVTSTLDRLAFGVMVGHHPWKESVTQTAGEVKGNQSAGSVTPLAIDGIDSGSVTGNSPSGNQGTNGLFFCTLSALYTAEHFGSATIQPGWYWRSYHGGNCTP